jgi:hypothetical protein
MKKFWFVCAVLLWAQGAMGFPTMVTHGYRACATCHASPSGGGALTPYGRQLASELLNFPGKKESVIAAHSVMSIPEWLVLGGNLRALQSVLKAPGFTRKNFTLMQADLELGFIANDVTVSGTMGYQNPGSAQFYGTEIFSRRHGATWRASEEVSLQVGKLPPVYGVYWPDHWLLVRREFGFGEGTETYQAQLRYMGETAEAATYFSLGRPDAKKLKVEKAAGARAVVDINETSYAAFNLHVGWQDEKTRYLLGPGLALGLAKRLTLFADLDWQMTHTTVAVYRTLRLDYEPVQGLHAFAVYESSRAEPGGNQETSVFTIGAQLFPFPNFEFSAALQFSQVHYAWLLGHYYL